MEPVNETAPAAKSIQELELEFKQASQKVLIPGIICMVGLCLTLSTLGLIMEDGNLLPALLGLVIALPALFFVIKARKGFDEANRRLQEAKQGPAK